MKKSPLFVLIAHIFTTIALLSCSQDSDSSSSDNPSVNLFSSPQTVIKYMDTNPDLTLSTSTARAATSARSANPETYELGTDGDKISVSAVQDCEYATNRSKAELSGEDSTISMILSMVKEEVSAAIDGISFNEKHTFQPPIEITRYEGMTFKVTEFEATHNSDEPIAYIYSTVKYSDENDDITDSPFHIILKCTKNEVNTLDTELYGYNSDFTEENSYMYSQFTVVSGKKTKVQYEADNLQWEELTITAAGISGNRWKTSENYSKESLIVNANGYCACYHEDQSEPIEKGGIEYTTPSGDRICFKNLSESTPQWEYYLRYLTIPEGYVVKRDGVEESNSSIPQYWLYKDSTTKYKLGWGLHKDGKYHYSLRENGFDGSNEGLISSTGEFQCSISDENLAGLNEIQTNLASVAEHNAATAENDRILHTVLKQQLHKWLSDAS